MTSMLRNATDFGTGRSLIRFRNPNSEITKQVHFRLCNQVKACTVKLIFKTNRENHSSISSLVYCLAQNKILPKVGRTKERTFKCDCCDKRFLQKKPFGKSSLNSYCRKGFPM